MELETINKLYLELSQVATAKTKRELELETKVKEMEELQAKIADYHDLLRSARVIAERKGKDTHWKRWIERLAESRIDAVTAKTFRILPSDREPGGDHYNPHDFHNQ